MSTEATGDGQADAVGAVEPDVAAAGAGAEPPATAVAEGEAAGPAEAAPGGWDMAAPSAWGAQEAASAGDGESADLAPGQAAREAAAAGEAPAAEAASASVEAAETDVSSVLDEATGADAAAEVAQSADADEDVSSGEAGLPDEADDGYAADAGLEYNEEYDEYDEEGEPEEVAEPRRARRWPRVLLAFGFVVLAAVIVAGAIAIVGSVTHGFKKPVKITYTKSALFSLKTGECFDPAGQSYSLVSCDSPHVAEVFSTFTLSGSKWPGDTAVAAAASGGCATRLTAYVNPQLAISLSQNYVYPDSIAWQAGVRTVICEVRATSGQLTGSVREASATAG